jgi:nucleoside-diphosphate-sugar epimerase
MKDLASKVLNIPNSIAGIEMLEYPDSYLGDEPNRRCPDISKLISNLGFQPQVSLDQGLTKFLNWAKENYAKIDF